MWAALLKLLGVDPIGKIVDGINTAYRAKLSAQNDADKLAADLTIKQLESEMEMRRNALAIRQETAGFWEMRLVTFLIAGSFTLHLVLVTLDTCFGFGWRIAAFPHPFDEWEGQILLSFFGVFAVGQGVAKIASAIRSRK